MSIERQIQLKFLGVDFPVVNVNSKQSFSGEEEVLINIEPQIYYPKDAPNIFKIIQNVQISVENYFTISIVAVGGFELNNVEDEELKKHFINVNAPAIMFPYVRSFITTLTSNLGNVMGTLNIPPQFFKGDFQVVTDEDFSDEI
ncbi:MAG: protein-export chaperone SecB [Crocinitomicaceae bacterium]|nr:protein-export chaperone SecB [Crocinitomicaceae bacterium]